jgi:hypothetical protein
MTMTESELMLSLVGWANRRLAWLLTDRYAIVYTADRACLLNAAGETIDHETGTPCYAIPTLALRTESRCFCFCCPPGPNN